MPTLTKKLQDTCNACDKPAIEVSREELSSCYMVNLKCGHFVFIQKHDDNYSPFESLTFDGDSSCAHSWGEGRERTICQKCNAKRLCDYQITGARLLEEFNGRFGLFDEQGLGKTIQALAYLNFHKDDAFPLLWVTKSGIKYQHAKEITRILGMDYFPQIITSGKERLFPGFKVFLASHAIFRNLDLSQISEIGIKTIVIDECQAIKNPQAKQTQALRTVVKDIEKIIPLSGTPWKNRGSEFFVVLNMLDPKMFHTYETFIREWVDSYFSGNKIKEGGIARPDKFKAATKHILVRRERVDVMPELPIISRHKFICEVDESSRKAYNTEQNKLKSIMLDAILEGTEESFETKRQVNESLMIMRQIVGISKVPTTVELAQDFLEETDRKLVIFVHHKECARLILSQMQQFCREKRLSQPLVLSSANSPEERFSIQDKFNGPSYRLLIASTLASGEGLNLQTCSDCIMHERQWNNANEEQAEGRFIRIGQQANAVVATYVHAVDTVDTILDSIVDEKRRAFHNSMNNSELNAWQSQDLTEEIIKQLIYGKK